MTDRKPKWHERWLASLPADRLLTRLLLESFHEHRWKYTAAALAMVMVAAATGATAWMMGQIVDSLSTPEDRGRVIMVGAGVALVFTFRGFAMYTQAVLMARAGNRIVAQEQVLVYDRMVKQGLAFFNGNASSDLLLKLTQSALAARNIIDVIVAGFIRDLLTLVALVIVMFYQQPVLSMISFIVAPIVIYGIQRILRLVQDVMKQELAGLGEIIKVVQETAMGTRVIKAFGLEERMLDRMDVAVRQVEDRNNRIIQLQSATQPLLDIVAGCAIASIVIISATEIFGQSPGTPGQLMSFVTAFLMSYEPANRLSRMRVVIESNMVGVTMLYDLLDAPQTMLEKPDAVPLAPGKGEVRLEGVSFAYGDNEPVLKQLDATFAAGKISALVGPSGGGKSTLINLLLRLYDPTEGRVLIDDQDIKGVTFDTLREKLAFVGQDTFLFAGSVLDNLLLARPNATQDEVVEAAKVANAHEFIESLPDGYNTAIGENGSALSGGQRQRLSIARAILRRAPILLLDEATSALDSHSEALVRDALENVSRDVTTIVIAHRLSTVLNAHEVFYVEDGKIVERGSVKELLREGGKFKSLYDAQFKAQSDAPEEN